MQSQFSDRVEAGELLANHLGRDLLTEDLVVVALPRGGVEVALPIARRLKVPLEVLIVRKLGAPDQPELAIGAIASGGFIYLNQQLIDSLQVTQSQLLKIRDRETRELVRRENLYQRDEPRISLSGKSVLLVDDGIATGATVEVAIRAIKASQVCAVYVAVPVAALGAVEKLHRFVDHIYSLQTPSYLGSIGEFYVSFPAVPDERVIEILAQARNELERNSKNDKSN